MLRTALRRMDFRAGASSTWLRCESRSSAEVLDLQVGRRRSWSITPTVASSMPPRPIAQPWPGKGSRP